MGAWIAWVCCELCVECITILKTPERIDVVWYSHFNVATADLRFENSFRDFSLYRRGTHNTMYDLNLHTDLNRRLRNSQSKQPIKLHLNDQFMRTNTCIHIPYILYMPIHGMMVWYSKLNNLDVIRSPCQYVSIYRTELRMSVIFFYLKIYFWSFERSCNFSFCLEF